MLKVYFCNVVTFYIHNRDVYRGKTMGRGAIKRGEGGARKILAINVVDDLDEFKECSVMIYPSGYVL